RRVVEIVGVPPGHLARSQLDAPHSDALVFVDQLGSDRIALRIRRIVGHISSRREGSTERVSWRAMSYVGAALSPRETKKLVLGRGSYIGDLTAPGLLHAAFVRSPHAHAGIRRIDIAAARHQPGIAAVLTGEALAGVTAPLRTAPAIEGLLPMEMATLPTDKVRFVGDPVACVVGEQRYQVEDACARVQVECAPLAAVVDPERAQD